MYIRRACLEQIGYLNEEKFGRGYGEENDLSQRALKNGWLNLLSPNMYAFHEGGVSFLSDKQALVHRAMRVIGELHPNYHADVQRFIEADPVKSARVIRYASLLATIPVPKILHISHSLGGGVQQHVEELAEYYDQRMAHILLTSEGNSGLVRISLGVTPYADSMKFIMDEEYDNIIGLLKAVGISAVHFHHTLGFRQRILRIAEDLAVVKIITVHDYYWLCANPTLTDGAGIYPGYFSAQIHNPLYPLPEGLTEAMWQEPLRAFIESADCIIFPSHATKSIFENVYRTDNSVVSPHIEPQFDIEAVVRPFIKKSRYTIGVLGAIGREKGADFLEEIAKKARKTDVNFSFKIIGYAYRSLQQVVSTGPYDAYDLRRLIIQNDLDLLFFPARWPETYSYTLSCALDSKLPIVAPFLGSFPERLAGRKNTLLFNHMDMAETVLTQLIDFVDALASGESIEAPRLDQGAYKQYFYESDYPEVVSRTLKTVEMNDGEWMEQIKVSMHLTTQESIKVAWQEALAYLLWRLRMSRNLRWLSNAVPQRVRRRIRLSLSARNNDDLARGGESHKEKYRAHNGVQ